MTVFAVHLELGEINKWFSKWYSDPAQCIWCPLAVSGFLDLRVGKEMDDGEWEKSEEEGAGCFLWITVSPFFWGLHFFEYFWLVKMSLHMCGIIWDEQETGAQENLQCDRSLTRWQWASGLRSFRFLSVRCCLIPTWRFHRQELMPSWAENRRSVNRNYASLDC